VDTGTFLVSALLIGLGVPSAANRAERTQAEGGRSYLAELGEGLRFIRAHTVLLSMILVATVTNFLDKPLMAVILPVYAKTIYGSPTSLGLALGAFGGGALVGSLVFGAIGRGWPRRVTFLSCWVLGALVIVGTLAATPPLWVVVPAGFFGGLMFGPINPIASTVIQENTPPQLLGGSSGRCRPWPRPAFRSGRYWPVWLSSRQGWSRPSWAWASCTCWCPWACSSTGPCDRWTPDDSRRPGPAPAVE
jgi:predicted MFS family arabinose efflux permease